MGLRPGEFQVTVAITIVIEIDAVDIMLEHSRIAAVALSLDHSQCFDPFARERLLTSARPRRNSHLVSKPRRFANFSLVVVGCDKPYGALWSTMARNTPTSTDLVQGAVTEGMVSHHCLHLNARKSCCKHNKKRLPLAIVTKAEPY